MLEICRQLQASPLQCRIIYIYGTSPLFANWYYIYMEKDYFNVIILLLWLWYIFHLPYEMACHIQCNKQNTIIYTRTYWDSHADASHKLASHRVTLAPWPLKAPQLDCLFDSVFQSKIYKTPTIRIAGHRGITFILPVTRKNFNGITPSCKAVLLGITIMTDTLCRMNTINFVMQIRNNVIMII